MSDLVPTSHVDDVLATPQAGPAAARGGALRAAGYGAGAALGLVAAAMLFRYLGVRDSGRYVTVTTIVALFGGLTDAGLWSIAVRDLAATNATGAASGIHHIVALRLVLSTAAALGAVAFAAVAGYPPELVAGVAVGAFAWLLLSLQLTWSAVLAAQLRFGWITALDLVRQVVMVAGIVLLILAGAGLFPFFLLAVPAALAALIPTALLVYRDAPLRPRFDRRESQRLIREVLPFAAATAAGALYFSVALILTSLIATEEQTGYFSASFRIVGVLFGLPGLIVGAALPVFARAAGNDPERLRFGVQRVVDSTAIFGAIVVLGLFVGAQGIIALVAGPDFAPAASVLQIQCLGLLASFVTAVLVYALLSLGRTRSILVLACGTLVVNVVLTLALVPRYGASGAAVATTVGELGLGVAAMIVVRRAMAPHAISVPPVARVIVLAVPFAALVVIPGVPSLVLAAVSVALYAAAVWALGWVPKDLLKDLRIPT